MTGCPTWNSRPPYAKRPPRSANRYQMTTNFGTDLLEEFWRQTLDPQNRGLCEALADDIAAYTGESRSVVDQRMRGGLDAFRQLWVSRSPDAANEQEVAAFYRDQFEEAYELADWHCGRTKGLPLNYAFAAMVARHVGAKEVLDFGSGIGSGVLCLAKMNCSVTAADV